MVKISGHISNIVVMFGRDWVEVVRVEWGVTQQNLGLR
jgi:hypothetical protein